MYFIDRYLKMFNNYSFRYEKRGTCELKWKHYKKKITTISNRWADVVLIPDSCVSSNKIYHYNLKTIKIMIIWFCTVDFSQVQFELILAPRVCMKEFRNCPIGRRTFVLPVQTLHDMAIWHFLPQRLHLMLASLFVHWFTFCLSSCPGKEHKEEDSRINSHCFEFFWM